MEPTENDKKGVADCPPTDQDLSLRQFSAVLGYLQYENTAYWMHSQFFIFALAALFGLIAYTLPTSVDVPWAKIYIPGVAGLGALALAILWRCILHAGKGWINVWLEVLKELEPKAFQETEFLRKRLEKAIPISIKDKMMQVNAVFVILWIVELFYLCGVAFAKWRGLLLL